MLSIVSISCLCLLALDHVTAQYIPDAKALTVKEFEHLYLDAAPNGLMSAISPCSNYIDTSTGASSNGLGRQTAAEWIRVAFRKPSHVMFSSFGRLASYGFGFVSWKNSYVICFPLSFSELYTCIQGVAKFNSSQMILLPQIYTLRPVASTPPLALRLREPRMSARPSTMPWPSSVTFSVLKFPVSFWQFSR